MLENNNLLLLFRVFPRNITEIYQGQRLPDKSLESILFNLKKNKLSFNYISTKSEFTISCTFMKKLHVIKDKRYMKSYCLRLQIAFGTAYLDSKSLNNVDDRSKLLKYA